MNKQAYETPKVTIWGNVTSLTQVGLTRPGGDMMGGSVNPPGHRNFPR
ncbi:MAG: hypothetical protein H0U69_01955 [Trueperaceae bacterium]|nr:hypothetical protein [Trueperaceae bacterium]